MRYVALFRGINVGGKNPVKMEALRALFEDLGYTGVRSCIQSGNIIFSAQEEQTAILKDIQAGFSRKFGFSVGVLLISEKEMNDAEKMLPFSVEKITEPEGLRPEIAHRYVYFLEEPIEPEKLEALRSGYEGPDLVKQRGRMLYFLTEEGMHASKMALRIAKTVPAATARNWKTVQRILELLESGT